MPAMIAPGSRKGGKRLATPWTVLLVGAAMVLLMAAIFPRAARFGHAEAAASAAPDSLKMLVLRGMFLKDRGGAAMHMDYARQLALLGDLAGACAVLDTLMRRLPAAEQPSLHRLAAELAAKALSGGAPGPTRDLADARLDAELRWIEERPPAAGDLAWAAGVVRAAGRLDAAVGFYARLGNLGGPGAAGWFREAAALETSRGRLGEAAFLRFEARSRAMTRAEGKADFLEGMRQLQAAGRLELALAQAELTLGDLREDTEVLFFLVKLARSADRAQAAERYAHLLMGMDGSRPAPSRERKDTAEPPKPLKAAMPPAAPAVPPAVVRSGEAEEAL